MNCDVYVVGMAPLMMHHSYTNYGGGGSGNMQQMQLHVQQQQPLHLQHHQMQPLWNNHSHTTQKRSKYYRNRKVITEREIKFNVFKSRI
jgi:hypothetical protein